jgi:hypothetical protein
MITMTRDTQPTPTTIPEPDAADYIGMSRAYLRQARHQGRGPAYLQLGRPVRYRVADLDRFLNARRVETRDSR